MIASWELRRTRQACVQAASSAGSSAIDWLKRAYDASTGPATRFQWGTYYINGLLEMTPDDVARAFHKVAQLPMGQAVAGESIDIAIDIAEAVVKGETLEFIWERLANITHHVAHALPCRRHSGGLSFGGQLYIDCGKARFGF